MKPPSRNGSPAFSLVELIVVTATLAILAGLLVPVVSKARTRAAQSQCVANLRSIGQAELLHTADHNGVISGSIVDLSAYLGKAYDYAHNQWPQDAKSLFVCPVRKATSDGWFYSPIYIGALVVNRSYGPNSHITGWDTTMTDGNSRQVKLQQANLSKTMIFMDCPKTVGVWSPSTALTYPHNGRVNTLFLDGHVEALDQARMDFLGSKIQHVFWRGYNWLNSPSYSEE